jgi:scyllo-inositol 2-dehydrogenase (NADP+)
VEVISQPQHQPHMYYEVEEFINLIKNGLVESQINSYSHSKITAEITDEVRKQIGLVYPADQK